MKRLPASLLMVVMCIVAATAGCAAEVQPLRVGAKAFDEQLVLAELTVQLASEAGLPVEPVVPCVDTYGCYQALRDGRIDVMVEYSGTGLTYWGEPVLPPERAWHRLAELYAPAGLEWMAHLGFDNGYRVAVRTDRAAALGLAAISDLERLDGGVGLACPGEYVRRPLDGYRALLRRHGLKEAAQPLLLEAPGDRVRALCSGRVNTIVLYATDGAILDPRVTLLEDDAGFFPAYEAAYLVRRQALKRFPGLAAALGRLDNRLDEPTMRRLNHAVQEQKRSPEAVALDLLDEFGLIATRPERAATRRELLIAVHREDHLDAFVSRARDTVFAAFPRRTIRFIQSDDPMEDVYRGKARLALVGAERFFMVDGVAGRTRNESLEAVAALGQRTIHLLRGPGVPAGGWAGPSGVQSAGSGGGAVVRGLLSAWGLPAGQAGTVQELVVTAGRGETNATFVLVEEGDSLISVAVKEAGLDVVALPADWMAAAAEMPFLRPSRIASGAYPGQRSSLDSLGSQVVLVGPGRSGPGLDRSAGPATAMSAVGQPLPEDKIRLLAAASPYPEGPDPILPSAWAAIRGSDAGSPGGSNPIATGLNIMVLLFLCWLAVLTLKGGPRRTGSRDAGRRGKKVDSGP